MENKSLNQLGSVEKRMEPVRLVAVALQESFESVVQFFNVFGNDIRQSAVFGLVPHIFDGIEFRCVAGKPFHLKPSGATDLQLTDSGTMGGQAITYKNERTTEMGMNFAQKLNKIRRASVVVEQFVIQAYDAQIN
jgi:hypothetical protein